MTLEIHKIINKPVDEIGHRDFIKIEDRVTEIAQLVQFYGLEPFIYELEEFKRITQGMEKRIKRKETGLRLV